MAMQHDVGKNYPTHLQDFDGFDIVDMDAERWEDTTEGSTTITQAGGNLVIKNTGAGTKGVSYYESIQKLGKNWRVTADMKLASATPGILGMCVAYLGLYKDATHYIKIV